MIVFTSCTFFELFLSAEHELCYEYTLTKSYFPRLKIIIGVLCNGLYGSFWVQISPNFQTITIVNHQISK